MVKITICKLAYRFDRSLPSNDIRNDCIDQAREPNGERSDAVGRSGPMQGWASNGRQHRRTTWT